MQLTGVKALPLDASAVRFDLSHKNIKSCFPISRCGADFVNAVTTRLNGPISWEQDYRETQCELPKAP